MEAATLEGALRNGPPARDAGPETLERYPCCVLVTCSGGFSIYDVVRRLNPNVKMHGNE